MAKYPDWVMAHKKKGTYINFVNGKYYLYAAHSERIPGTKKVRRVSDGYIGRITEEDGLIPARDKVSGDVYVYEYGLSTVILDVSSMIYVGFKKEFKSSADFVMVSSILWTMKGKCNREVFENSYLSVKFPKVDIDKEPTDKEITGIERGRRMIADKMARRFGNDLPEVYERLRQIFKVRINGKLYSAKISDSMSEWLKLQNIELEG